MLLTYFDVQDMIPWAVYFILTIEIAAIGALIVVGIPLWLISKFVVRPRVSSKEVER
jgi:hypothetical protein